MTLVAPSATGRLDVATGQAPSPSPVGPGRWSGAALPLGAALAAGLAVLARFGYSFGTGDQLVLSPKGISMADPRAYANDWFVHNAPQPHWFFDGVTYVGARLGALPLVYLAWWLLSLLAFGLGAAWLTRRFLPGRVWPALLLGPVMVAGPEKILGSTTPLLGITLPHVLAGCLAFVALAGLVNGYWRATVVASLLAGVVHVQHGANLAPVLLVAGILASGWPLRRRLMLVATATVLAVTAGLVGWFRHIDNGGDSWLEICEVAAPFHCDANSWSGAYLLSGFFVVGLALGLVVWHRGDWRRLLPPVGLPAGGLALAVVADWFNLPVLGELAQRFNAYRLAAFVVPFAALALLLVASMRPRMVQVVVTSLLLSAWMSGPDAAFHFGSDFSHPPLGLALLTFLVMVGAFSSLGSTDQAGWRRALIATTACLATIMAAQGGAYPVDFDLDRGDPIVAASLDIGHLLPEGAVLAAPPGIIWLKGLSQRAVIADCKNVPYGEKQWAEYKLRMAALGGRHCGPEHRGFKRLGPAAVESLHARFGASHVLLPGDDPKVDYAAANWDLVWRRAGVDRDFIRTGWLVFELPPITG